MDRSRPTLNQVNIVSGNLNASIAFYRRLGVAFPEQNVWRTATGAHHANAEGEDMGVDLDSTTFAPHWNQAWAGRTDLAGKVVVGFSVATREEVDHLYADLTAAGHRGLQPPWDAFWGARYAILEDPDGVAVGLVSPVSPDRRWPAPEV